MFIRLATDEQKRDIGLKRNCDPPTDRLTDLSSPPSFFPSYVRVATFEKLFYDKTS